MISPVTHALLLNKFILELDKEQFYDAHETLEALWFPVRFEDNNEVKLIKGFINASVCLELAKKGRVDASKKVWKNYLKYRPLLYKITSPHLNLYHKVARHVEGIKNTKYLSL
jgi:hypothetical protein